MSQPNNEISTTIKLYNSYTRNLEPLIPLTPGQIGLYCCGPTVYNFQHIGNFKTFIFEDILVRALRFAGLNVKHVMNITDVGHLVGDGEDGEDKMLVAMRREKKKSFEIAEFYTNKFFEDWDKLNLCRPTIVCKATDHIKEMIALIQRIEANGFAYVSGGNVYFDVSKFENYGKLALLDRETLKAGARIDVDTNKKNPHDFVLWFTKSKFENQELQWESPWGVGYPGWHIECSAMAIRHLGERVDIHCGGIDHIPVHHTNEIAQSEAATTKPWVNIWMHSEFLLVNNEKMAKSKGSFFVLDDLISQGFEPLAYRMLCLSAHYKAQLNFNLEALENSKRTLEKIRQNVEKLQNNNDAAILNKVELQKIPETATYLNSFSKAILNDLNTPQALAVLWEVLNNKELSQQNALSLVYLFDDIFGLKLAEWKVATVEISQDLQELLNGRELARQNKDWKKADELRALLLDKGYEIRDSASGPVLKKI